MKNIQWQQYVENEQFATKADFDAFLKHSSDIELLLCNAELTLYKTAMYPESFYCIASGKLDDILNQLDKVSLAQHESIFIRIKDKGLTHPKLKKITDTYLLSFSSGEKHAVKLEDIKNYEEIVTNYISTHQHHTKIDKRLLEKRLKSFNLKELHDDGFVIWTETVADYYETSYFRTDDSPESSKQLLDQLLALGAFEMELDLHIPESTYLYEHLKPYCTYECSLFRTQH